MIRTLRFLACFILFCMLIEVSAQDYVGNFDFEGRTRNYEVYLPQNFEANMPVVITIHGYTQNILGVKYMTKMHEAADTNGFLTVYPRSASISWNTGETEPPYGWGMYDKKVNDVGFISTLIDTLDSHYDIDLNRVYVCGISSGGEMTFRLITELGYRFAAAASVSGPLNDVSAAQKPIRPIPILYTHGTADEWISYYTPHGNLWSVEETLNYWIENNGCSLPSDIITMTDLDPNDGCTVEKISYTNCLGNNIVLHYKVIGGSHPWGHGTNDINTNEEILNFFNNYANPLSDVVFTKRIDIHPISIQPKLDSIHITAELSNPANHLVEVYAVIQGEEDGYRDSIKMFDDGLHGDTDGLDNLWGKKKIIPGLTEDMYQVKVSINDLTANLIPKSPFIRKFTTKGPIILEKFEITSNDTILNPGDRFKFALTMRNLGITDTVYDVYVNLISDDKTILNSTTGTPKFGNIAPGESLTNTSRDFAITLRNGADSTSVGQHELKFEFTSKGEVFWLDTYILTVETLVDVNTSSELPTKYELSQNFPNPFNPSTTISYSIPKDGYVILQIYDALGNEISELEDSYKSAGNYSYTIDANELSSGIYYYRLQAGDYVETKKMILLK